MTRIAKIADKLSRDWFDLAAYETLSGDLAVHGVDDAYAVQLAVQSRLAQRRGVLAGRKIALSSKTMQQMCGIDHPVAGGFFADDVRRSGAQVPQSDFLHLGVEFELALEMKSDVPPQQAAHTAVSVRDLIAGARPAFEIIEDKNADYTQLDALTLIADNAWCGGIVLGSLIPDWSAIDLGNIASCVYQDGVAPEQANTGAADPLGSLAWVLNHFSGRGLTVSKGEHIITGSAVRTRFPVVGDRLRYDVGGASVAVEIT